jgi:hypothetical protein
MKEDVIIEGYLGELDYHIETIQNLLPSLEITSFSSKSPVGIGKNITLIIKDTSLKEAELIEKFLIDNNVLFVGSFGSHKFFKCENQENWIYLTGQYEDMPTYHISISDICKIHSF